MNERQPDKQPPQAGISLNDIYYVLFRHKWMILAFAAAGIVVAAILYFTLPTRYSSEAKLLIRYVMDTRSTAPTDKGPEVKSPDARGETIINSELEILTSLDLAKEVVTAIGASNILAKAGGGASEMQAAALIANPKNLMADVPKASSIIRIQFEHPDPSIVQPVLNSLISSYVTKHLAIHRGVGVMNDFLKDQIRELEKKLIINQNTLRDLKATNSIISLEDSRKALSEEIMKIQDGLLTAEAELAERQATLHGLQPGKSDATATELGVPAEKVDEYKTLCERWYSARKRESDSFKLSDENPSLIAIRSQLAEAQKKKKDLEEKFPQLAKLNIAPPASSSPSSETRGQALDSMSEFARAKALEAKIGVFTNQLARLSKRAVAVEEAGSMITDLQREKEQLETNLRFYQSSLEQAKVDPEGAARITNIGIVQAATPPAPVHSKNDKIVLGALFGLIIAGLALAFGFELFLDPRIKRASEIESKLHLPLFMSIPSLFRNGHHPPRRTPSSTPALATGEAVALPADGRGQGEGAPSQADPLKPYYDAVRDRLTMYFQARNMTHKPKLVGVTSCGRASGVTTLASGLAASLSELGSGNVLLVDMAVPNGAAHPFHHGQPARSLLEALESEPGSAPSHGGQLVLAKANEAGDQAASLVPSRFSALMPKLKASDYDYIVFDMPPVTSTSPTASLASMLDMTFFVIESEKANREVVKGSIALLAGSRANVAAILNKTRNYLPAWLHHEV